MKGLQPGQLITERIEELEAEIERLRAELDKAQRLIGDMIQQAQHKQEAEIERLREELAKAQSPVDWGDEHDEHILVGRPASDTGAD